MEYTIRDRGREIGSFSLEQIEAKLDDHQIGMMAEVYDGGQWITVAELIENLEEEQRGEREQLVLQQEASAKRQEEARLKAEEAQRRDQAKLEMEAERTRQMEIKMQREELRQAAYNRADPPSFSGGAVTGNLWPHRGTLILVLGILGLVFCSIFTGLPAWVMGYGDLKKIEAGIMDPAGAGTTKAGLWCGFVSCVIFVVFFVIGFMESYQ